MHARGRLSLETLACRANSVVNSHKRASRAIGVVLGRAPDSGNCRRSLEKRTVSGRVLWKPCQATCTAIVNRLRPRESLLARNVTGV